MWGSGWAYHKPGGVGIYVRSGMMLVAFSGGVSTGGGYCAASRGGENGGGIEAEMVVW